MFSIFINIIFISTICFASDSFEQIPSPRLQIDTGLTVESIIIKILRNKVSIEYIISNNNDYDVTYNFLLYSTKYAWPGFGDADSRGNFDSLKVFIDGKESEVTHKYKAFIENEDVTEAISSEGIPINYENFDDFNKKYSAIIVNNQKLNPKFNNKYFDSENFGTNIVYYGPKWHVYQRHLFNCSFTPGKKVSIRYEYKPFWGNGYSEIKYMPFYDSIWDQNIFKKGHD